MFLFFFLQLLIQQGQGQFPTMIHLTGRPLLLLFFALEYFVYPLLSLFMLRKNIEKLDLFKMFQKILKNKSHHCLEVSKTPLKMLLSFKCRPHDLIRPFQFCSKIVYFLKKKSGYLSKQNTEHIFCAKNSSHIKTVLCIESPKLNDLKINKFSNYQ